jgi:hypothetical protein
LNGLAGRCWIAGARVLISEYSSKSTVSFR